MLKRKVGRPRKSDPNRKRITVEQAVELSRQWWAQFGLKGHSKGYIYNLTSNGTLATEHHGKYVFLYEDEVREKLCG